MPRQGGQKTESDSDSGSDLSVEEEPEKTPALLSVQMPTDEKGKAMYQAVQAVWSPRNLTAPVEKIKSGMAQFGDTIKGLRDSWKDKNESLRKAELPNAATAGNIPQLKADVAHYRQIVETVVNRSLQHGHPAILKRYVTPPTFSHLKNMIRAQTPVYISLRVIFPPSRSEWLTVQRNVNGNESGGLWGDRFNEIFCLSLK